MHHRWDDLSRICLAQAAWAVEEMGLPDEYRERLRLVVHRSCADAITNYYIDPATCLSDRSLAKPPPPFHTWLSRTRSGASCPTT